MPRSKRGRSPGPLRLCDGGERFYIPVSAINRLLAFPELALALLSYLAAAHCEAILKLEMLTLRDVEYRLLYGLATLAGLVQPSHDGSSFPIPMTQAEVASYIGATRETTSTTLSDLKDRQLVTLSRRLIVTVHPDLLVRAANDKLTKRGTAV